MTTRERDELVREVKARFESFVAGHRDAVTSKEAAAEISAMLRSVSDPTSDPEVAETAAKLYWVRGLALGRESDFDRSLWWSAAAYRDRPEALPDDIREPMAMRAIEHLQQ